MQVRGEGVLMGWCCGSKKGALGGGGRMLVRVGVGVGVRVGVGRIVVVRVATIHLPAIHPPLLPFSLSFMQKLTCVPTLEFSIHVPPPFFFSTISL